VSFFVICGWITDLGSRWAIGSHQDKAVSLWSGGEVVAVLRDCIVRYSDLIRLERVNVRRKSCSIGQQRVRLERGRGVWASEGFREWKLT
jgi:hypothetical protein